MTAPHDTKRKSSPSHDNRATQGFLALLLVLGLCLVLLIGIATVSRGPIFREPTFYPLIYLTHERTLRSVVWISIAVLLIGLLGFAFRRSTITALGAIVMFFVSAALLLGSVLALEAYRIDFHNMVSYRGQAYRLVAMWPTSTYPGGPFEKYVVLKCDAAGLMCSYLEATAENKYDLEDMRQNPRLLIDTANDALHVSLAGRLYPVRSGDSTN